MKSRTILTMLAVLFALPGCQSATTTRPQKNPKRIRQHIMSVEFSTRSLIRVSFRLYLDRNLEKKALWKISPSNTITSVSNCPDRGRRSGTYIINLAKPVRYGIAYTLSIGNTLSKTIRPPVSQFFAFPGGKRKALVMSYDDGSLQDRRLVDIFNKYGIKGTFHLNSGKLGRGNYLKKEEIRRLFRGHEISCHTISHPDLSKLSRPYIVSEVRDDRKQLEKLAGHSVPGLSYPFGGYNTKVIGILRSLGISYARTVKNTGSIEAFPGELLAWHPTCHQSMMNRHGNRLLDWNRPSMALLFVWGHSWELDRGGDNNNWKNMANFCRRMGGKRDIWYAGAQDVAEYLTAIRKLMIRDNGKSIYNPAANRTVWVLNHADNTVIRLVPGRRIMLP